MGYRNKKSQEQKLTLNKSEPLYVLKRKELEEGKFTMLQKRYIEKQGKFEEALRNFKNGTLSKIEHKKIAKPTREEILKVDKIMKYRSNNKLSDEIRKKREEALKKQIEAFLNNE